MLPVYVLHHRPLGDRKAYLDVAFKDFGITPVWLDGEYEFVESSRFSSMSVSQISLSQKHFKVNDLIFSSGHTSVVLEDDVVFLDGFLKRFDECLTNTPQDFEMVFFGNGANLHPSGDNRVKGDVFKRDHPATRCTDSYVIKPDAAKRIVEFVSKQEKICLPTDHHFNIVLKEINCKVYWWDPPLVEQGSQSGKYVKACIDERKQ